MPDLDSPTTVLTVMSREQPVMASTERLLVDVRRSRSRQRLFNGVMLLGLVAALIAGIVQQIQTNKQSTAIVQLTSSLGTTCTQANTGVLPAAVQVDCTRAQRGEVPEIVQGITGPTGATGAVGPAGPNGEPGEGITGTAIDPGTGHLIITYTGGGKVDLGAVVGKDGLPGLTGQTGGSGPQGRGVSSITVVNGRLIVTYSDGTTSDAGPAPVGPPGKDGASGADGAPGAAGADGKNGSPAVSITITRSDGTTVDCPRTGGTDDAPAYTCQTP